MWKYDNEENTGTALVSETFFNFSLLTYVLDVTKACRGDVHVQYPAIPEGVHLQRFFDIEEVVKIKSFVPFMTGDLRDWVSDKNISIDVIFAPNHPSVRKIVEQFVYDSTPYGADPTVRAVFWEYLPTGRFGDKLVSGEIKPGDRVLVYNAVSIQGGCIGERLPSFVEALGGEVVAIACFAKGTTPKVRELEEKWGNKFYSTIQVDIPVYKQEDCPMCKAGEKLIPWTEL